MNQRFAHHSPEHLREDVMVLNEAKPERVSTRADLGGLHAVRGVAKLLILNGEPAGIRTQDPRLKRAMLYRLSYRLT